MSDTFQIEMRFLGIQSRLAFVRAPEGNGCAERFIRTLKDRELWYPRTEYKEIRNHAYPNAGSWARRRSLTISIRCTEAA